VGYLQNRAPHYWTGTHRTIGPAFTDKSFVLWTSSWESSGSEDVAAFCNPIYRALLGDLKATFAK